MAGGADSVLAFRLTDSLFGIRLSDIKEIIQMPSAGIVRAPTFPRCVLGIINVRGRIAPVVNTWLCLGRNVPRDVKNAVVFLCERDGEIAGFAVDEIVSTVDSFDAFEETAPDAGESCPCQAVFREVNGSKIGLITAGELYAAARDISCRGLGA